MALAFGAAVRISTAPVPAVAVSAQSVEQAELQGDRPPGEDPSAEDARLAAAGRPRWEEVWTKPTPSLAAMHLSPDGGVVSWVDRKGSVRSLDAAGRTRWQTPPLPGINRVVATLTGVVLAYSWLNPAQPSVAFLSPKDGGKTARSCSVEGAVWDVAVSADGSKAVIGTGQRYVYVVPLASGAGPSPKPAARWRTPGIPESVALAAAEPLALLGTWQDAGVSAFALDGTVRWRHDEPEPARLYQVCLSADGATAVGVSAHGPRESDARLHVWDAVTSRPLWTRELGGFRPKALTTRHGQFVAVTYVRTLSYRTGHAAERKLALFDRQGRRLWEKGGLFFSPDLVALSANGARLTVTDGVNTLYTLDAKGHIVSHLRLPANPKTGARPTIRETVATQDGAYLLVRRGDGQITLLKAT
jgi:hypothetical protein